eukprot:364948-Chlamydomonas_euryale.AAC.6
MNCGSDTRTSGLRFMDGGGRCAAVVPTATRRKGRTESYDARTPTRVKASNGLQGAQRAAPPRCGHSAAVAIAATLGVRSRRCRRIDAGVAVNVEA